MDQEDTTRTQGFREELDLEDLKNAVAFFTQTDDDHRGLPWVFYIEGIGILCIGLLGCFINLGAIWRLLYRPKGQKRHTFHYLLVALSAYDFLHIVLSIACFALPQISKVYNQNIYIHAIPFLIPLAQMTLSGSTFTTVALTVERYVSLCAPFLRYRYNLSPKHYIVTVLLFSTIYNSPRFFEWQTFSESYQRPCIHTYLLQGSDDVIEDELLANTSSMLNLLDYEDTAAVERLLLLTSGTSSLEALAADPEAETERPYDSAADNCSVTAWNVTLLPRSLRKNQTYLLVYVNWMNFLINILAPLITMFVMNLSIYKVLRRLQNVPSGDNPRVLEAQTSVNRESGGSIRLKRLDLFNKQRERELLHDQQLDSLPKKSIRNCKGRQNSIKNHLLLGSRKSSDTRAAREEGERDASYTRASILIVVVFALCHFPRLITNTVELFMDQDNLPKWVLLLVAVNHLLVTINSSFNFLFYVMATKRKRSGSKDSVTAVPTFITSMQNCQSSSLRVNRTPEPQATPLPVDSDSSSSLLRKTQFVNEINVIHNIADLSSNDDLRPGHTI